MKNNNENIEGVIRIKQNTVGPILILTTGPLVIFFMAISISQNIINSLIVVLFFLIIAAIYQYLNFSTYVLDSNGLNIIKKAGQKTIPWTDIISMSTQWINNSVKYEIKTPQKTYRIPYPENYRDFETYIESHASLEIENKSMVQALSVGKSSTPDIQRWRKIGQEYKNTSLFDWFQGLSYSNGKTDIIKFSIMFVLFLIATAIMIYEYRVNNGIN